MLLSGIVADQQDRRGSHCLAKSCRYVLLAGNCLCKGWVISRAVMVDVVRTQNRSRKLLQQIIFFVRCAIRADYSDRAAALRVANLLESVRNMIDSLLPGDWNQLAIATHQGLRDAIVGIGEIERIASLDA